ncbi:MAG: zinc ribbon domain-containing protein [Bacteroidales bacterium]|nr:zinc ribbon domain-containing protein [Bacteroidales bacterium]
MECPHCNQEHSENALFCENTGKKIEKSLKSCTNQECPDFGKYLLPIEAAFCPRCGQKIGIKASNLSNCLSFKDELSLKGEIYDRLFPIYGVSLGKTMINQVDHSKLEECDGDFWYSPFDGIEFLTGNKDFPFEHMLLNNGKMPPKWKKEFDFSYDKSFDDLITILRNEQFFFQDIQVRFSDIMNKPVSEVIVCDISGKLELTFSYINYRLDKIGVTYRSYETTITQSQKSESEEVYMNYIKEYAGKKIARDLFEMKISEQFRRIGCPDIAVGYISSGSIDIGDMVDVLDENGNILETQPVVGTFLIGDLSELKRTFGLLGSVVPHDNMRLVMDKLDCSSGCVGISVRGVGVEYGNLKIGGFLRRKWD